MKTTSLSLLVMLLLISVPLNAQEKNRKVADDIMLIPLVEGVWQHITWTEAPGYGRFSSNGLVIAHPEGGFLLDTPINDDQTRRLLDYLYDSLHISIKTLIINHFHDDCLGGLNHIQSQGIYSLANQRTYELCVEHGLPLPDGTFTDSLWLEAGDLHLLCWYPGAAHTRDNIVVWVPDQQLLFAGCMVKSASSSNLGNTADADLEQWPLTMTHLLQRFSSAKWVVPGHGPAGNINLIHHTINLLKH